MSITTMPTAFVRFVIHITLNVFLFTACRRMHKQWLLHQQQLANRSITNEPLCDPSSTTMNEDTEKNKDVGIGERMG